ncbi:hypothetical protein WJX73_008435, partial [Symbiochloris irregularis]
VSVTFSRRLLQGTESVQATFTIQAPNATAASQIFNNIVAASTNGNLVSAISTAAGQPYSVRVQSLSQQAAIVALVVYRRRASGRTYTSRSQGPSGAQTNPSGPAMVPSAQSSPSPRGGMMAEAPKPSARGPTTVSPRNVNVSARGGESMA